jgi:hypothetical protein
MCETGRKGGGVHGDVLRRMGCEGVGRVVIGGE